MSTSARVTALLAFVLAAGTAGAQERPLVLHGADVIPVAGERIANARIVIEDGRITAVGPAASVRAPDGAEIRELAGSIVIPGLIDTHSHLGLYPRPRVPAHADGNESTGPTQPGLRALDAIWPGDPGIRMAQAGGVTTANIMPGSGNPVGGQTAYVKLRGATADAMLIRDERTVGGMKMANGENPKRAFTDRKKAPATRMKVAAIQRSLFVRAQEYRVKWARHREKKDDKPPARDLDLEAMVEVLEGRRTVHYHTHRADDIMTALRLRDEFGFDLVLQHVTEGFIVAEEIARRGIPTSIIVVDSPGGKHEAARLRFSNAARLEAAGVRVAIHTDDPITSSRLFLRAAAFAVRGGMSEAGALRAITLDAARMLRLDHRIGSIEPGKDADLVVLSGEPFSVWTKVLETYVDGERVFDRADPRDHLYATGGFAAADWLPEDAR